MKYLKTKNIYKKSNLEYNANTGCGFSYGWYKIVDKVKGKVVLNTYKYSISTSKHIWCIYWLLEELGIKIDYSIEAPKGLDNIDDCIKHYETKIINSLYIFNSPNKKKATKQRALNDIKDYKNTIKLIKRVYA